MSDARLSSCAGPEGRNAAVPVREALGFPAVVLVAVFLMPAVVLRVLGVPLGETLQLLGGVAGIAVVTAVALGGGRRVKERLLRALQAGG
ncbi:hypothetical protein [Streptomyces sp. NPDC091268]|uniref:hypothetical protein n=1 Tax=Streptomyces sp. NPDC091268 TaxID=3365979 RepID=UPI00381C7C86